MADKIKLAYLVTHPIQYQAPLLRMLASDPGIDLTVFFCTDLSVRAYNDPGFNISIKWDVPLLEGYKYDFLPAWRGNDKISFWRPFNYGLYSRLQKGQFDVLWIHGYARFYQWMAILFAKILGIKVLIRDEASSISTHRGIVKRLMKKLFFFCLKPLCDGFLAIGTLNRSYYIENYIDEEKIFLVPYAVDNHFFQEKVKISRESREVLRQAMELQPGRPIILFASKMIERKRAIDLLEAYALLSTDGKSEPRPYLIFIGDGPKRSELAERAKSLEWTSIKFLGFKNQSELPAYYDLCDVFVLPSSREPWGLVVNEVMNAECAVIVSDQVCCGPDLVCDGENGYVYKSGDISVLASKLQEVLTSSVRWRSMGKKSMEIVGKWGFSEDITGLKKATEFVCKD